MGKGTIIDHLGDGLYTITEDVDFTRASATLATLQLDATELQNQIDVESTPDKLLRLISIQKIISTIESKIVPPIEKESWCVDGGEELTGVVGLIDVPGDTRKWIVPSTIGSGWMSSVDGILQPVLSSTPAQSYFNIATQPAKEKYKPRYRTGTITAISDGETGTVSIDSAESNGFDVNLYTSISVLFVYQTCNKDAFEVGDKVVVQFLDRDWERGVVIGFQEDPRDCPVTPPITAQFTIELQFNGVRIPDEDFSGSPIFISYMKKEDSPSPPYSGNILPQILLSHNNFTLSAVAGKLYYFCVNSYNRNYETYNIDHSENQIALTPGDYIFNTTPNYGQQNPSQDTFSQPISINGNIVTLV